MPRRRAGFDHHKRGTNNVQQALKRDRRAAKAAKAAAKAAKAAAKPAKAAPKSPEPQPPAVPQTVIECRYSMSEQQARRREMIIYWYVELDEPPEREWHGHGGTLSVIADKIGLEPDSFGKRDYRPIEKVTRVRWGMGYYPTLSCSMFSRGRARAVWVVQGCVGSSEHQHQRKNGV